MTIYWYLKPISERLRQVNLSEPVGLLGPLELEKYSRLKFIKRKTEWLAGRLAAKDLIQTVVPAVRSLSAAEVQILSADDGSPTIRLNHIGAGCGRLSITHSNDQVACAYSPEDRPLGIDLEKIEQRGEEFVADYFTPGEQYQILQSTPAQRAFRSTLLWSAKEAVLKALSTGLRMDTRSIEFDCPNHPVDDGWQPLEMRRTLSQIKNLRLLWRREENFVLTICLPADESELPIRVEL
jgi:4'-phosphopantetheinyl transferase